MAAGGVDLAPGQPPAFGGTPGKGGRQAAAGGCAQFGFDAKRVDQCAVGHRVAGHLQAQVLGPALFVLQAKVLQVLHDEDQRGGRATFADRSNDLARTGQVGATAGQCAGHGETQQAVAVQQVEVVGGELAAAVVAFGVGGQGLGEFGERAGGRGVTHGYSSLEHGGFLRPYSYG
ncbi:Uncharacterised protein [Pseudomonas putida]|nr:Uncharacterised protein [Pseudomonas putida]